MTQAERKKRRKLIAERTQAYRAVQVVQEAQKSIRQLAQETGKGGGAFAREQIDDLREIILRRRELSF